MLNIKVNTQGAQARLERLHDRLRHLRPFFESDIVPILQAEVRDVFLTEGQGTWPALSPAYAAEKAVRYPGKGILRASDAYFHAATGSGAGALEVVSDQRVRVGVRTGAFFGGYPAVHEEGSDRVPARPVFALAARQARPRIVRAFRSYFGPRRERRR